MIFIIITAGQIIKIECRAWAKNIIYQKKGRDLTGFVSFEIQIDHDDMKLNNNQAQNQTIH